MSLDAIGLVAKDLEATAAFYKMLGIELTPSGGEDHLEATLANGMRLMVDSEKLVKQIMPEWTPPAGGSNAVLCFRQSSPQDVDNIHQRLIDAGHTSIKEPWDAFWGQRYASVKDPNDNQIDLFAQKEASP